MEEAEIRIFPRSALALVDMRVSDLPTRVSENGPAFLDAATTHEKKVIELNKEFGPELPEPIVAVYPQDGTIVPTHAFAILDGAPWVEPEQAKAANVFLQFLLSDQQQRRLLSHGLRPAYPDASLGPPIDDRNGANPQANLAPIEVPEPQVILDIVELWEEIRNSP